MSIQEFFDKYNGVANTGNTSENKGECVGLSSLWMDNFGIPHVYGHAKDLYTNAPDEYFAKISNAPDAIIQDGDIAVWSEGYNGTYGHTGVAYGKHDINHFDCFEQNDPLGSAPHIKKYNYAYVLGWLRPKNIPQPTSPDNNIPKAVRFDQIISYLHANNFLSSDHSEDYITNDDVLSVIKGLRDETVRQSKQFEDLNAENNNLKDQIDDLKKQIAQTPSGKLTEALKKVVYAKWSSYPFGQNYWKTRLHEEKNIFEKGI